MIRIYVDRAAIERTNLTGDLHPPIIVDDEGDISRAAEVTIAGPSRLVYSPRITHAGAHVWVETDGPVQLDKMACNSVQSR